MNNNYPMEPRNLNRRGVLQLGAASLAALGGIAAISRSARAAITCTATPSEIEGPYWVEEMLNRADIRSDPATGVVQAGLPLRLMLNVSEIQGGACSPVAGCYVDIWHCNAAGAYSDEPAGMGNPNTQGQKWLRGYQVTDAHGNVRFLTIFPGWYMGRTVHIHFRVRKFSGTTTTFNFTSQLYFTDAVATSVFARAPYNTHTNRNPANNAADNLYNAVLLTRHADNTDHIEASHNIIINANPGLWGVGPHTPTDADSIDHFGDFGGGAPRLV